MLPKGLLFKWSKWHFSRGFSNGCDVVILAFSCTELCGAAGQFDAENMASDKGDNEG